MMGHFLPLLVPHIALVGARRRARAVAPLTAAHGVQLTTQYQPVVTFCEYEFNDNQLDMYRSSIVLDYRAPK